MGCTCVEICATYDHCACIFTYDDQQCYCICQSVWREGPHRIKGVEPHALGRETKVQISTRNIPLADLGALLAKWCDFEILVPARALENKVTETLANVSLESAIKELGMLIADPQEPVERT